MWFDSHTHLFECEPVEQTVARARAAGVGGLLVAGVDEATSEAAIELSERSDVWAAVGIHPNSSAGFAPGWMEAVARLASSPAAVAVGETGLDFYRDAAPRADQEAAFAAHIELSRSRDKALVVHTRASVGAALDMLEGSPPELVAVTRPAVEDDAL
ncbi:MAG TPA: TatD family hydrolase, partial [Actinomycetota bacterium]|nr:TatD family hydrolase [Actinomycetota bacterium]